MAQIRPLDLIGQKWATVTPQRAADYESGVRNPVRDWSRESAAAHESYKAGVQAAVAAGTYGKAVTKAGTATWQDGAIQKGVSRWGPGVALAVDKYTAGYAPYHQAIASVTLPPRYARRDPRNLERVKSIVDAVVKVKKAQAGV